MQTLNVTQQTFLDMLGGQSGLIASGVTFEAKGEDNGTITITFLGGY